MENPDNIVFYCDKCAPVPETYTGDLQELVGGFVKVGFPANLENVAIEHMWVKVTDVSGDNIIGTLDNEPAFTNMVSLGDTVEIARDAIEEWHGQDCRCTLCGRPIEKRGDDETD